MQKKINLKSLSGKILTRSLLISFGDNNGERNLNSIFLSMLGEQKRVLQQSTKVKICERKELLFFLLFFFFVTDAFAVVEKPFPFFAAKVTILFPFWPLLPGALTFCIQQSDFHHIPLYPFVLPATFYLILNIQYALINVLKI